MNKRDSDRVREVSPAYGLKPGDLTYEDYLRVPAGQRYELVEGELRMVPSPSKLHQAVIRNLVTRLAMWAEESDQGEVYPGPYDVLLGRTTVFQPDVLFISKDRLNIAGEAFVDGAPDLAVEILSPTTEDFDRITKHRTYSRYGVKEYWVVDADSRTVEVNRGQEEQLVTTERLRETDVLSSPLLQGLEIRVEDLFRT